MAYTRHFTELNKTHTHLAGGKGASLGEMTQAGIPVPPGFVILSTAFDQFLAETDLGVEIESILRTVHPEAIHTVEYASETIKALILSAAMPADIAQAITGAFTALDATYVAVRSSATAEDGATAAWAGQLESYLNTTEEHLLENVKKCWASLFTPRAIFYRFEKALHESPISVAVVVQTMVQSDIAGIAFSVHPVTEDRNQLIIEAGYGLGEAIVSGQITPDSYVVEKQPRCIVDVNVAEQQRGLYRGVRDNEWQPIGPEKQAAQKLTEQQVLMLADLVLKIEQHYGFPCDIEWAFQNGAFYIVQSRPITTLRNTSEIGSEKVRLEKTFSREHSLFYIYIWNNSDLAAYHVQNLLFLKEANSDVVSVWYDPKELNSTVRRIAIRLNEDEKYFIEIKDTFEKYLAIIKPYLTKEKHITSLAELKEYFYNITEWWSAMAIIAAAPDVSELRKEIRDILVEMRNQTQEYTDEADNVFITFFATAFPEYRGIMFVMTPDEIFSVANKKLSKANIKKISKRKDGYALLNNKLISLDDFTSELEKNNVGIYDAASLVDGNSVKGNTAYPGMVRGRVRVILSKNQIGHIQEGDILVTAMTTPEYLPALRKAVAFVTDEGGITSHAAIVSRELKKPCIIGTKIASQVLRDGDVVEVDADNGVVRIIQSVKDSGTTQRQTFDDNVEKKLNNPTLDVTGLLELNWDVQRFNAYPFFLYSVATLSGFKLPWGLSYKHFLTFSHNKNIEWHYDKDDYSRIGKIFWEKIHTLEDIQSLIYEYRKAYETSIADARYSESGLERCSVEELKKLLEKQVARLCASAGIAHIIECATYVAEQKLLHEYLVDPAIIKSSELSFLKRAAQYAHELCSSGKNDVEILRAFSDRYAWVQSSYLGRNEVSLEFIHELADKPQDEETYTYTPDNLSKDAKVFIEIVAHIFSWQDERKANILASIYASQPVLEQLAKKIGIPIDAIKFLLPEEIHKITEKHFRELLIERSRVFVDYTPANEERISMVGQEAEQFIVQFTGANHIGDSGTLHGQVAFAGNVTGSVRVCLSLDSINNFKPGEVLVASMTRPEYIPAMKKAIAFVTDEGGITCHAAIVAREMKKPCVIGTKNATKVLKDGDVVEVDAVAGMVRILERQNQNTFDDFEILKQKISTTEFDIQKANASVCAVDLVFPAYNQSSVIPGVTFPFQIGGIQEATFYQLVPEESVRHMGDALFRIAHDDFAVFKRLLNEAREAENVIDLWWVSDRKNAAPADIYREAVTYIRKWWQYGLLGEDKGKFLEREIIPALASKHNLSLSEAREAFAILTQPAELSGFTRERFAFMELAIAAAEDSTVLSVFAKKGSNLPPTFVEKVHRYVDTYFYRDTTFSDRNILTLAKVLREIASEVEVKTLQELYKLREEILFGQQDTKRKRDEAMKRLSLTEDEKNRIAFAQYFITFFDRRKEVMMKGFYYYFSVIRSACDKLGLSYDEVKCLTVDEIVHVLNDPSCIGGYAAQERVKNIALIYETDKPTSIYTGESAKKLIELCLQSKHLSTSNISGAVACKGNASGFIRGVVRIVSDPSRETFSRGEILVTSMTRIEFVPIMKLAAAIVTDEGGIACHAAIVSRELGIPCVIGTKIATQVLKDGDMVEVDTNIGVVRIIPS